MRYQYSIKTCAICANFLGNAVLKRDMSSYTIDERVRAKCCIKGITKGALSSACADFDPLPGFKGRG